MCKNFNCTKRNHSSSFGWETRDRERHLAPEAGRWVGKDKLWWFRKVHTTNKHTPKTNTEKQCITAPPPLRVVEKHKGRKGRKHTRNPLRNALMKICKIFKTPAASSKTKQGGVRRIIQNYPKIDLWLFSTFCNPFRTVWCCGFPTVGLRKRSWKHVDQHINTQEACANYLRQAKVIWARHLRLRKPPRTWVLKTNRLLCKVYILYIN